MAAVRRATLGCALALLAALAACSNSDAGNEAAGNFSSDPERAKIERIVRDYVISHPEILDEAVKFGQQRETAKLIAPHRKDLETPFAGAWAGARDADVVLVEFFDYACGYCRASNADVAKLLAEDKNLKVVWRELPVLGENSLAAAQTSLAAAKQGRFRQFFDQLYAAGQVTPDSIARVQKATGVATIQSAEFMQEIEKNLALARQLGASGTPTFVIGNKILHGMPRGGYQELKDAVAEARKKA